MSELQDKVKILAHTYGLALGEDLEDDDGDPSLGYVEAEKNVIFLDRTLSGSKLQAVLLHELLEPETSTWNLT